MSRAVPIRPSGKFAQEGRAPCVSASSGRQLGLALAQDRAELRGRRTGGDAVDADAVRALDVGELLGEEVEGVLGHGVGAHAHRVLVRAPRPDVDDDPVFLRPHEGHDRLGDVHGADEVELELLLPCGGVLLVDGDAVLVQDGAGDVAEDVDAAELVDHLADHRLDGGVVGDVGLDGDALAAQLLDGRGGLLRAVQVDVGDGHGRDAFVGQQQRYLLAEAHLATGPVTSATLP